MKRGWALASLGAFVFVVLLAATLPAGVLLHRIPGVSATGVGGSIWSGRADNLSVQGIPFGRTDWRLFALALLRGRLDVEATFEPAGGKGSARCLISMSRDVTCSRLDANVPLQNLPLDALPQGWSGYLDVDLQQLELKQGWPVALMGQVDARDLAQSSGGQPSPFGSFRLEFPANASNDDGVTGALRDLGGPLDVVGTLRLAPDRTYVIDGRVAARAGAPQELARSLEYLGLPDAEGRREFSLSGSL